MTTTAELEGILKAVHEGDPLALCAWADWLESEGGPVPVPALRRIIAAGKYPLVNDIGTQCWWLQRRRFSRNHSLTGMRDYDGSPPRQAILSDAVFRQIPENPRLTADALQDSYAYYSGEDCVVRAISSLACYLTEVDGSGESWDSILCR
jgi:hypothetical protein